MKLLSLCLVFIFINSVSLYAQIDSTLPITTERGPYDDSGKGIFGRKVIFQNWKALNMTKKGNIVIKTCVNRSGIVTYTEIIDDESTITDRKILDNALNAAKGYKFEPNLNGPKEECGKLVFRLSGDQLRIRGN